MTITGPARIASANVRFDSSGYPIAGTFTQVPAAVAAALVITGSGRIDRDSGARPHGCRCCAPE